MVRTTKDTASFQKSSHFTMTARAKSATIVTAAQEQASSVESSDKIGADGGAGVVAGICGVGV